MNLLQSNIQINKVTGIRYFYKNKIFDEVYFYFHKIKFLFIFLFLRNN